MASLQNNLKLSESGYKKKLKIFLSENKLYNAAICYNDLGNIYLHNKNFKKAISFYKKALNLKQIDHIVLDNLGTAYRESDNVKKAISFYKKALKINSKYDLSLLNLEFSLMKTCDWKKIKKYNFKNYSKTPFMSIITEDDPPRNFQTSKKFSQ